MSRKWNWGLGSKWVRSKAAPGQAQGKRATRRSTYLTIQELERRTLLSVTASLNSGVLDVDLSSANDQALITPSGTTISLTGTGFSNRSFAGVTALVVQGTNTSDVDDPNQRVTFGGSGGTITLRTAAGTDALSVSGVTSVTFTDVTIDATRGNVDVEASETTPAVQTTLEIATGKPVAAISVNGATLKADNITLDARATSTYTYRSLGPINKAGLAWAEADLEPSAAVKVTGPSTLISVNRASGNITIAADTSTTVDTSASAGTEIKGIAVNPADAAILASVVNSSAVAGVGGGSTVSAGTGTGTLSITSTNETDVTTDADGTSALGGATGAVTLDNSLSQAFVTGGSTATGGTVDVLATTTNTAETSAKSTAKGAGLNSAIKNLLEGKVDPAFLEDANTTVVNPAFKTSPALTAASGGLPISVAGAVAVTKFTPTTQAFVDSSTITATKAINVSSSADDNATTDADASTTTANADNSVGVAVAINNTAAINTATLESTTGQASLTAPAINVAATAPVASGDDVHDDSSSAISGVTGENVGVAGGLALNIVSNTTEASVPSGSTVSTVGDVTFNAQNSVTEAATAQPPDGEIGGEAEDALGMGAGVALNIDTNTTLADLEDTAQVTGAHDLTLTADSDDDVSTNADSGSSGGSASISPSVAITVVTNTTDAQVGAPDAAKDALFVGGAFSATATHTGRASTSTGANAGDGGDFSAGVSIALGFVTDLTTATTARSINVRGGGVTFEADNSAASLVSSSASADGGPSDGSSGTVDFQNAVQRAYADTMGLITDSKGNSVSAGNTKSAAATPSAQTSDGSVTVAAAVAVNIVDSEAVAAIPGGLTITATGPLTVNASNDTGSPDEVVFGDTANAWGTDAGEAKVGVGAAVGLNLVKDVTAATIGASTIKAVGVTVNAGMLGDDPSNYFSANATSGAGSSKVGVAGAVAINIVNDTSEALVETGASVAAGGGDVNVTSLNVSSDLTFAVPAGAATGDDLGVGASVAVNVITNVTWSEIQNGAALTGAGNVAVTASGSPTITTWGQNGSEGGIAVAGGVATTIASDKTTARIGSDSKALDAAGGLTIDASGAFSVNSLADATTNAGESFGLGASVVVSVTQDAFLADLDRNVSAGGPVSVTDEATSSSQATAVASEEGSKESDGSADQQSQSQFSFAKGAGGSNSPNVSAPPTSNSQMTSASSSASSKSGGSKGQTKTGIAAAVAVNVITTSTVAEIENGLTVTSKNGSLTVGTTNQSSALALADGRAVKNQTSIGAAVSLNVAKVTNTATIGLSDKISADGVNVTALMPAAVDNTPLVNDFSTQGLGVAVGSQTGIAGTAGINVVTITTTASIGAATTVNGAGTTVKSFGGLNVQAANDETFQNIVFTVAVAGDTGAGAAVNVNVLTNPTYAFLDSNVQANVADATRITAESSLTPSQDPIPNNPSDTLIATGTLTAGSPDVSNVDAAVISVLGGSANTPFDGEPISGTGIPSGTFILDTGTINFTGIMTFGSDEILSDDLVFLNPDPLKRPQVGETVSGPGIIPGATIVKIEHTLDEGTKITISEPVFASGANPLGATKLELTADATASGPVILNATPVADAVAELSSLHPTNFAAGVGAASGGNGVAGSFAVNVITQTTHAYINDGAAINTLVGTTGFPTASFDEGVTVSATEKMAIVDWTGAIGGGDDVGAGAALDVNIATEDTQAYISTGATVDAASNVRVLASENGSYQSITAAGGLGGSTAIAGAASIEVLSPTTDAFIDQNTTVDSQNDVLVQASRLATINTLAGQIGLAEKQSAGASVSTVVDTVHTNAYVAANDTITALGLNDTVLGLNPSAPGVTTVVLGLGVIAANFQNLQTIAVGGSLAGSTGIAGSGSINVLTDTTLADIGAGAVVIATRGSEGNGPGVIVTAGDLLTLLSTAGAFAGGGSAGLGVGADVDSISKNTQAYIATAKVTAQGNVIVGAYSSESLTSVSASVGIGGSVAVAGSAGVYVLSITTRAFIGNDPSNPTAGATNVQAGGSIVVSALEQTLLDLLSGNISGSGELTVGAAAGVPVITKTTEAFIGANAKVSALGLGSAIQADNGRFDISYAPYGTAVGVVQPDWQNTNLGGTSTTSPAPPPLFADPSPRLGDERIATPETVPVNGLAVTAVNTDSIQGVGVDGGVSGSVAANLSGTVGVITNQTDAYIGNGASVNSANAGAAKNQSVLVAAGNDTSFLGIAAALSAAGEVSITPGVVVIVINNTVTAAIDDGVSVTAAGDIAVQAHTSGDILSIAASGAIAGEAAVGGAVSYVGVNDKTQAFIGDTASTDAAGTHASAGGNVLVDATDDTVAYMVTGSLAIGIGTAGVGGGVGIALLNKNTDAFIGNHATVNALGNSPSLTGIFTDAMSGPDSFETLASFHGVAVQAATSENVTNIAVAGGVGFYAGLAGGVSVEIFQSNTQANIGTNANINESSTGASAAQAVDVAAVNQATSFSFAGAIAGSIFAALSGGVDVGLMKNSTTASIGGGSVVDARQDVDVFALSNDTVQTYAIGVGAAAVALEASVSVWSIGEAYNAGYSYGDGNSSDGISGQGLPTNSLSGSSTYSEGQKSGASSLLGSLTSSTNNGATGNTQFISGNVSAAQSGITGSISGDPVTTAVNSQSQPVPLGTIAFIGSSVVVNAGGSVNVQAKSLVSYNGTAGGLVAGVVGLGASVAIANIQGHTQAYIDTGSTVTAGGNVSVGAQIVSDHSNGTAFAGTGAIIAVGAQVVDIQDTSTVSATLNSGVTIPQAQLVQVTATSLRSLDAEANSGAIGGLVAGAAVAIADTKGSTVASIGSGALIGQTGSVGSVDVTASSTDHSFSDASAVSGGIGSVAVNVADSEISPQIQASIGSSSHVRVGQNVTVSAGSLEGSNANVSGVQVAGLAVGVSLANATLAPTITSFIDSGSQVISTGGGVSVSAVQQTTNGAQAGGTASAVSGAAGQGSNISAESVAQVSSYIGSAATIPAPGSETTISAPGTVSITASGTNIANADASTLSVGVTFNVAAVFANATASGVDTAYLGTGSVIGTAANQSGGLVVTATGVDQPSADVSLSGGGAFSGEGGKATATTDPTLTAYLGNTSSVNVSGNITVESNATTEGNATTTGASGGIADVGESDAVATVTPTLKTYIGSSANIIAGGSITVESLNGATPVPAYIDGFTASGVSNNTITFEQPVNFIDENNIIQGFAGTFEQNGNPPIGGLANGRVYPVLPVVNSNGTTNWQAVQIGIDFSAAEVDTENDTINFPQDVDNLQTGDLVIYEPETSPEHTVIPGLIPGNSYLVRVIDGNTIKLVDPSQGIQAPTTFDPQTDVSQNTINLPGFSDGHAVTYNAPQPLRVPAQEISNSTINLGTDDQGNIIPDNFSNGEPVVYEQQFGVTPIGGLTSGHTYYVIQIAPNEFQLASSETNANLGHALTLTLPDNAAGIEIFTATDQQAIGGLVDGDTYYVINATSTSFQLAATPSSTKVISLKVSKSGGIHSIGVEGIDFTGTPTSGDAYLVFPLNPQGASGTYQLVPVGVSLVQPLYASIDDAASATAVGSGAGLVTVVGSDAEATSSPTIATYVGALTNISAGGNIAITSNSNANASANGTDQGGGFVGVGDSTAGVTVIHQNSATIGAGAVINTAGNFTLGATSLGDVAASSQSAGGGVVDIAQADTTVSIDPETQVAVGANAQITAGAGLTVESQNNTTAENVSANADGDGLGINSNSDSELHMGDLANAAATTTIATGAALLSKETNVLAVTAYNLLSSANAEASAFAAKGESTATTDTDETSHVTIMPGATITGTTSVNIAALLNEPLAFSESDTDTRVAFGQGFATANTNVVGPSLADASQPDVTQIDAEPGATIVTPDLLVQALISTPFIGYGSDAYGGFIVGHYYYVHGQVVANRTIHWNADVVSGGGGAATTLIVNANGSIDPSSTITPTITATQIIVPDISDAAVSGSITFQANDITVVGDTNNSAPGLIDGNQATFYYSTQSGSVELLNESTKDMVVNDIDLNGPGGTAPNVDINVDHDNVPGDAFAFNVVTASAPASIDIENQSTTGAPNIILSGFINNPIGSTTIIASRGSIQSTGQRAVVLTNILDVEAPKGSIGSFVLPFAMDLVQSEDSNHVQRPIQVTVLAGGSAYLNITGFLRDPDFNPNTTQFIVPLNSVQTGGALVAFLQESDEEFAPGVANGGIVVFEDFTSTRTTVFNHFRQDTGNGSTGSPDPGFFDSNDTLINSTYSFNNLTAGGNVQLFGIPTAQTQNGKLVTPIINVTGFTNINPTATATGAISATSNGNVSLTETSGAMRVAGITSSGGNVVLTVPPNDASGDDFTMESGASIGATQGSVTIDVADNVTVPVGTTITAGLTVLIQGDFGKIAGVAGSIIDIAGQIFAPIAKINGGPDDDAVSLTNVPTGTVMTITTGGGVNTVNIGSIAPPAPNKGILGNVQGPLTVKGNGNDTLNVDDTGATIAGSGTLTATALTGLNMGSSGIAYGGLANLNIYLGSGGNTFLVTSTAASTSTFLNSGKGADTVNVNATTGPLTVNTGGGTNKNTINVGSLEPATGGFIGTIKGALDVIGSGHDTMKVDDTGSTVAKTGTLTATTLTGLNMGPSGITYGGLSSLNISLGAGVNTFTIANTAAGTTTTLNSGTGRDTVDITTTSSPLTVNTQTGTDTVNVQGIGALATINAGGGNDTINVSSDAPTNTGTLLGIAALLKINGGTGSTTTNVNDTGDTTPSTSTLTATTLKSTAFGTGGSLSYTSLAALNISMGSGGNTFTVTNTAAGTTTTLNSGTGSDTVKVTTTSSPLVVNTQTGSDTVNVQGIGALATINAGGGNDTINVSSNAPTNTGTLSGIAAILRVNGGTGSTKTNVSDKADKTPSTSTLTATTLSSTAFGAGGSLSYSSLATLNILMGSGGNTFTVANTAVGTTTTINSGTGSDTINVQATGGPTTVNTGGGKNLNVVNVGSKAPATGGVLNNIQGALTVVGNHFDTMNADATGNTAAKTGTLTSTALTGLSMGPNGITYSGLANLNINLGSGGNTFTIASTAVGTDTFLGSGTGADTVNVQATSGPATVNTGGGSNHNTVNVGSKAPATGGVLNNIQGALTVVGNGFDTLNADATGNTAAKTGTLTATTLTGLSMGPSGITYSGLANLNINLGSGGNTFKIVNTAVGTNTFLNSGTGADTVNVQATSSPTTVNTGGGSKANVVNVGSKAPAAGGVLNNIQGALTVVGNHFDTMNADATGNTLSKTGTLTATTLTGLSMGPSGITYSGLARLNIALGMASDVFNVQSSAAGTSSTIITQATGNTWNVGSKAPSLTGGVLSGIQGPVFISGGGSNTALSDTINFDDSGSTIASEAGDLTDNSLTGLGMLGGVTFLGQTVLNITLGNNGTALQGFITNNLPATTDITGGPLNTDSFIAGWDHDFNGTLNLSHIGDAELDVDGEFYGHLNTASPAYIDSLIVGGSVNVGSSISAQQIDALFIGVNLDINLTLPGIAGAPAGTDALGNATIGGSLPEGITLTAASIGSLAVGTNGALAPGSHNLAGIVDVTPGDLGNLTVGPDGSITTTAQVNVAGDLDTMTMEGATPNVGQVMAGVIDVAGTFGTGTIAGGTPGLFIAGHVGTIGAYGGFGPIVLRVIEAGVEALARGRPGGPGLLAGRRRRDRNHNRKLQLY